MRLFNVLVLIHVSFLVAAQKIEFTNDSLFINSYYVDGTTNKSTLDSLLMSKGKLKKVVGKHMPGTLIPAKRTKITYSKEGLILPKAMTTLPFS